MQASLKRGAGRGRRKDRERESKWVSRWVGEQNVESGMGEPIGIQRTREQRELRPCEFDYPEILSVIVENNLGYFNKS